MTAQWIPAWLYPLVAVAPMAVLAGLHRFRPARGLELADAASFSAVGRRTRAARTCAALTLALIVAAGATLLREADGPAGGLLPDGATSVVVLDVSASVSDLVYHEIAETLRLLSDVPEGGGRVGLVLFSDTAYTAIPPGAPASELRPFVRYFVPRGSAEDVPARQRLGIGIRDRPFGPGVSQDVLDYVNSPWFRRFSGGTQISTGLVNAREALERAGIDGRVLLISDLSDAEGDRPRLAQELAVYAARGIQLDVVALPPATAATARLFRDILGDAGSVVPSARLRAQAERGDGVPVAFLALVGFAALLIAVDELRHAPLRFSGSRA
jgi:hypothetical protein